jgi:hypothetical protein
MNRSNLRVTGTGTVTRHHDCVCVYQSDDLALPSEDGRYDPVGRDSSS